MRDQDKLAEILRSHVGASLRFYRILRRMKGSVLAEKLGISTSSLSEIETGKRLPDLVKLFQAADTLNIPVQSLLIPPKLVKQPRVNRHSLLASVGMLDRELVTVIAPLLDLLGTRSLEARLEERERRRRLSS